MNIREVLGQRWLFWLWPQRMTSSGLGFPVIKLLEEEQGMEIEDGFYQAIASLAPVPHHHESIPIVVDDDDDLYDP